MARYFYGLAEITEKEYYAVSPERRARDQAIRDEYKREDARFFRVFWRCARVAEVCFGIGIGFILFFALRDIVWMIF